MLKQKGKYKIFLLNKTLSKQLKIISNKTLKVKSLKKIKIKKLNFKKNLLKQVKDLI